MAINLNLNTQEGHKFSLKDALDLVISGKLTPSECFKQAFTSEGQKGFNEFVIAFFRKEFESLDETDQKEAFKKFKYHVFEAKERREGDKFEVVFEEFLWHVLRGKVPPIEFFKEFNSESQKYINKFAIDIFGKEFEHIEIPIQIALLKELVLKGHL